MNNYSFRAAEEKEEIFLGEDRVGEFWAAIKTALAGKADLADLEGYTTPDAVATAITSALTNYATNTGVTTAITTALANYMTTSQVNDAIASAVAAAGNIVFKTVDALPETGESNVIYLVPNGADAGSNVKDEYMWIDGRFELFGSTRVDLTQYWSKQELRPMTSEELQAILV